MKRSWNARTGKKETGVAPLPQSLAMLNLAVPAHAPHVFHTGFWPAHAVVMIC
jgi:hypothetical protein